MCGKGIEMRNRTVIKGSVVCAACVGFALMVPVPGAGAGAQPINEVMKIVPADNESPDWFGFSVAIGDGVLVAGAHRDDINGPNSGSVYLFDSLTGVLITNYTTLGAQPQDLFGVSVDISNGIVVAGAPGDDNGGVLNVGSVSVFNTSGFGLATIFADNGTAQDSMGRAVATGDFLVAAGAPFDDTNGILSGKAYVSQFIFDSPIVELDPGDNTEGDLFGSAIALDQGVVAVGAPSDDDLGPSSGSVTLFDATDGSILHKLLAADGEALDEFGYAVSMHSGLVAVGASEDDDNGDGSGSVYVFDVNTGVQISKLTADDGQPGDHFGYSVAVRDGLVAVGALVGSNNGLGGSGAAYLFDAVTGQQIAKFAPSDAEPDDEFGHSIALDAGVLAVGAPKYDSNGADSGAVYLFDAVIDTPCNAADLTSPFGVLDLNDLTAFIDAFQNLDLLADLDNNGVLDLNDVGLFIAAFTAGCP